MLATRKAVGDGMDLMIDPGCEYENWGDALKVGKACDEAGYFWYEDPYKDGGISAYAHKRLREFINTPILMGEHIRGIEPRVDNLIAEGTDFVRADVDYDGGITGVMKLAHVAEGFGLDVEIHAPGHAPRHCMAAIRNTNYYELGLVNPKVAGLEIAAPDPCRRLFGRPRRGGQATAACRCRRDLGSAPISTGTSCDKHETGKTVYE